MAEFLKILMLEDLEEDAGLVDRALKKDRIKFERVRVDTRDEFIAALNQFDPDLVLSDHSLPQFNSIEALQICRASKPDIPFILVTGAVSEEFAVSCLKQGADDYVLKTNLSRLPSAMNHALRQKAMENDRRTQEIRLQKKNSELSKVNNELDSFVYSVSHNLRAPLASILGIINLSRIDQEPSKEKMDNYLEMIEASIHRLDHTIREILDYSRNARSEVVPERFNLMELIEDCIHQLRYLEGFVNVKQDIEILGDAWICSDVHRLSVALTNIICNGIMYQDKAKPIQMIRVIAHITDDTVKIVIQDNGIGIGQDQLPKVFEMFYRGHHHSQGAGLGLYVAREVIGKISGTVHMESTPGEGSTVILSIPNLTLSKIKSSSPA